MHSLGYKLNKFVEAFGEYEYIYFAQPGTTNREHIQNMAQYMQICDYLEEDI